MIGLGIGIGFLFAVGVLAISAVSVPLLLDRDVGLFAAIGASLRAVMTNPGPMAVWGLIVAAGLVLGTAPLFLGLIFVMPVLGHATWHLYRRLVVFGLKPATPRRRLRRGVRGVAPRLRPRSGCGAHRAAPHRPPSVSRVAVRRG